MSVIHIIAGPPGIGKSTRGAAYISQELDVLNEDDMRLKYKEKGFIDYNEYSIYRVRDIIKEKLIRDEDFALELNLGFQHQYEYAISAKQFSQNNKLHVIIFYTDSLQLCLDRAKLRYENGLHLVKPEINFDKVDHAIFVNANTQNKFSLVAVYNKALNKLQLYDFAVDWFENELRRYIEGRITLR
jgi:predicted ABC-type ATPase